MNKQVALSVIIIYNPRVENLSLNQVLKSVAPASDLVLFDAGEKSIQDFSEVRNRALLKAREKYVLFVDSDEIVTKDSWEIIAKIVSEGRTELVSVLRSDIFLGKELKGGEGSNQRLVRMGKKEKLLFERKVHEVIKVEKNTEVLISQIKLLHHSHESIGEFFAKVAFYSRVEAEYRQEKDKVHMLVAMIFYPVGKFLLNLIFRHGYRDGMRGLSYAVIMSLHSLFVRIHGWELVMQKVVR